MKTSGIKSFLSGVLQGSLVFLIHGILRAQTLQLHPVNPHYFNYKNKAIVLVGSGEHYGALMNTAFDLETYFATLKKDGLNHTRVFMGAYFEKPGAFGIEKNTLAPKPEQMLLPWAFQGGSYDLTLWNPAYFQRLHQLMALAGEAGVIVEVTLFSSYYGAGWDYHPFHAKNNIHGLDETLDYRKAHTPDNGKLLQYQETYVRKLVAELNAYDHFYFEIQNEPWADIRDTLIVWNQNFRQEELKVAGNFWKNTIEIPSGLSLDWHRTVSGWIRDEEKNRPKKHLISHNIANFKLPVPVTDDRISIYNFHYAFPESVDLNYKLNKAIGFNETGFAGRLDSIYRRQAWRFMMSGGALFSHLDYSFSTDHPDGTDTLQKAPGGGSPALRKQLRFLRTFVEGLNLAGLRPAPDFIYHVEGAFRWGMQDGRHYALYLEALSPNPAKVQLLLRPGNYLAEWYEVNTGRKIHSEPVKAVKKWYEGKAPAGMADLVLLLKKTH
ncbi:MAG TPA: hypothetical protein PKM27_04405 [Saprospiraceae bacterium]|nr:hypothetical protein [Saprospiraceae bacterium]HNT21112.1 hypothetical protein [Saprospiraceae bacterium]